MSKSCAILEDQTLSLQVASSSAVEMPKIEINLFDFVSGLQSRKNWKESYLTGRFRVDEVTGEIEPVIKTLCKDQSCLSERQSLQRDKAILKKNLANHEKCITGLSRQHTQILKVFNKKDKEIERQERKLKGIFKINKSFYSFILFLNHCIIFSMIWVYKEIKYKKLLNRLKASNIPKEVQSLLGE